MALKQILQMVAVNAGLTNSPEIPSQRAVLIAMVNIAAEEIYEKLDLPECNREICVQVTPDSMIALPPYVGEVRSIRDRSTKQPWTITDLKPRYSEYKWLESWNNFRIKGYYPTQRFVTNGAPLRFEIASADNTSVTVTGSTATAHHVSEAITMDATSKTGTKSFLTIDAIVKNDVNQYDINVYDAADNLMAIVYNNFKDSRYQWLDVSQYPGGRCGDYSVMEVLYKMPLGYMSEDADTFSPDGSKYDTIIINKTLQLLMESEEGKELRATYFHTRTEALLNAKVTDKVEDHSRLMDIRSNSTYSILDQLSRLPYGRGYRRVGGYGPFMS